MKEKRNNNNSVIRLGGLIMTALALVYIFVIRSTVDDNSTEELQICSPSPAVAVTPTNTPIPTPTPFKEFEGVITGNAVRFRAEPSEESGGEKAVYFGNIVSVISEPNIWWEVKLGDEIGYIFQDYIKAISKEDKLDGNEIKDLALKYVGTKYKWGCETPEEGFDCSGFTLYVFGQFGIQLNRIASEQALNGIEVSLDDIQVGDLVLFKYYGTINHAGIYIGDSQVVHAANAASGVRVSPLSDFDGAELIVRRFEVKNVGN